MQNNMISINDFHKKVDVMQRLRDTGMTAQEVGDLFGMSDATVRKYTITNYDFSAKRIAAMREANQEAYEDRREYYIPLMLKLRALGYSNREIAEKTGFCDKTIRNYIGNNSDEVRLAVYRVAGAKRRFRNLAVKNQIARDNNEPIPAVAEVIKKEVA